MYIQPDVLTGTPFSPPKGGRCIINELPTELLSHIFSMGVEDEDEDEDDDYDDSSSGASSSSGDEETSSGSEDGGIVSRGEEDGDDSDSDLDSDFADQDSECVTSFELLVSHVCHHWRAISLSTPALWANVLFDFEGNHSDYAMATEYLQRSRTVPVSITIDLSADGVAQADSDDSETGFGISEMKKILPLVVPHLSHWRALEVMVSNYAPMNAVLVQLGACAEAPLLEVLELYHYEDSEGMASNTFVPARWKEQDFVLFGGNAPRLTHVSLWGVHLDWARSLFLSGLVELELAYHTRDVRPSYAEFARIIRTSPQLTVLSLCLSGPAGGPVDWYNSLVEAEDVGRSIEATPSQSAVTTTLTIASLQELVVAYHDAHYIMPLLDRLALPKLESLSLDMEKYDCKDFLCALTRPAPATGKSILGGLKTLKITGMPCRDVATIAEVYIAAPNVTSLNLDFHFLDDRWFRLLLKFDQPYLIEPEGPGLVPPEAPPPEPPERVYLPRLETFTTSGLEGSLVCKLVEARREQGVPLKRVFMDGRDNVGDYEDWLRENLTEFELFENSDTESVMEVDWEDSDDGFDSEYETEEYDDSDNDSDGWATTD